MNAINSHLHDSKYQKQYIKFFELNHRIDEINNISDFAKLLVKRILHFNLFGKERCFIGTNIFIAEIFSKSITTVSNTISTLKNANLIIIKKDIKLKSQRRITFNFGYFDNINASDLEKNELENKVPDQLNKAHTSDKKIEGGLEKSLSHKPDTLKENFNLSNNINNTIINNINNNIMEGLKENFKPQSSFLNLILEKNLFEIVKKIVTQIFEGNSGYEYNKVQEIVLQVTDRDNPEAKKHKPMIKENWKEGILQLIQDRLEGEKETTTELDNKMDMGLSDIAAFYDETTHQLIDNLQKLFSSDIIAYIKEEGHKDVEVPESVQEELPITNFKVVLGEMAKGLTLIVKGKLEEVKPVQDKYKSGGEFGNLTLTDSAGNKLHVQVNEQLFSGHKEHLNKALLKPIQVKGELFYNKKFRKNSIRARSIDYAELEEEL